MPTGTDADRAVPPTAKGVSIAKGNGLGNRRASAFHVSLILLAGILARIPFHLAYRPIWSGDSPGYAGFYVLWTHRLFFLGERTPVYPFFLGFAQWIAGVAPQGDMSQRGCESAVLLQSLLGILSAVLFYFALRILRINQRIGLGASLFFATIPGICIYELNILNMALSCSLMVLVVALFLATMRRLDAGQNVVAPALTTGIALSLAVLNRPDLLIFAILLLAVLALTILRAWAHPAGQWSISNACKLVGTIASAIACAVLGWMVLMYIGIGQFRITTLDGWNRSRTVYNLFDRVDPEDQAVGSIMAGTYQALARHGGTNLREIMWPAQDELFQNFGQYPIRATAGDPDFLNHSLIQYGRRALGWIQVPCRADPDVYCWDAMRIKIDTGDYLGKVSAKLARKYPGAWLHNVAVNFFEESFDYRYTDTKPAVENFEASSGDEGSAVRNAGMITATGRAVTLEAPLLTLLYCITLSFFLCAPVLLLRAPDRNWLMDKAVAALTVASVGTIIGTTILAGLNRVYTLPHLPVFILITAYIWQNRSRLVARISGRG